METYDVDNVEIFAAGTWNGESYSGEDLDAMVHGFYATKDALKPYLKLGHDEKQKLAQSDGLPALGWLDNLRRAGDKLVADFKRVPKKIMELIKAGAYRRVSAEVYWNLVHEGKKYPYLLKAVSLLGGDTPAVPTLDDIMKLYKDSGAAVPADCAGQEVKTYELALDVKTEDTDMKDLNEALAALAETNAKYQAAEAKVLEFSAKVDALEKEKAEAAAAMETATKRAEEAEAVAAKYADEKRTLEVNARLDKLIEEKKIVPAQREMAFALLKDGLGVRKYKLGDKEMSGEEVILQLFESSAPALPTEEKTKSGDRQSADEDNAVLADKASKYAAEKGVSYREALLSVHGK
jgi:hypothetical protein